MLFEEQDVRPPGRREVVGDAAACDAAPYYDDPRLIAAHRSNGTS
jgi:hypothetical protein